MKLWSATRQFIGGQQPSDVRAWTLFSLSLLSSVYWFHYHIKYLENDTASEDLEWILKQRGRDTGDPSRAVRHEEEAFQAEHIKQVDTRRACSECLTPQLCSSTVLFFHGSMLLSASASACRSSSEERALLLYPRDLASTPVFATQSSSSKDLLTGTLEVASSHRLVKV